MKTLAQIILLCISISTVASNEKAILKRNVNVGETKIQRSALLWDEKNTLA